MEYKDFKLDFVTRTLSIVDEHDKYEYGVTLLTNCLLGLIILPKEKDCDTIEAKPLKELQEEWGVEPHHIRLLRCDSCRRELNGDAVTLREVVKHLRNAVAHVGIEMMGDGKEITHVEFVNRSTRGRRDITFKAVIPVTNLRTFAVRLGTWYKRYLEELAVGRNNTKQGSGRRPTNEQQ